MHERTQPVVETSRPMNRTRVMIVDDHQVVRAGLKTLINGQPDLAVITEAGSGREAMEQLRAHTVDVLLLDLSLPDVSGLDVLKHAKAHYESVGVLILSAFPEAQYGLNVLRGGAHSDHSSVVFLGEPGSITLKICRSSPCAPTVISRPGSREFKVDHAGTKIFPSDSRASAQRKSE